MIKTLKTYGTAAAVVTAAAVASFLLVTGLAWRAEARGTEAAIAALEPLPATGPHIAAWAAAPVEAAVELDASVVDAGAAPVVPAEAAAAPPPPAIVVGEPANAAIEGLAAPVDPQGDPAGTFDLLVTWWKAGAFKEVGILVFFVGVWFASKRIAWLQTGYRVAVVSIVLEGVGDLVARLAAGAPLTRPLIMSSIFAAILVFLKSKGPAKLGMGTGKGGVGDQPYPPPRPLDGDGASGGKSGGLAPA